MKTKNTKTKNTKTKILIIALLATMLGGCIVVPAHPYAYRPTARVYVY
jgi:hypothetical protein